MAYKKFTASTKQLTPDAKYGSKLVSKFINCVMWQGKKTIATKIVYDALEIMGKRIKDVPPLEAFERAIDNVRPNIEVRSKRVGGSNYQVPMQVNKKRRQALAFRWIIQACRAKSGKPIALRMAQELGDAFRGEGVAMTQRNNVHRMAEANKAFSHFAW